MKEFSRKYLSLLKSKYKTLNLTRILDEDQFYTKQVLDSIIPLEKSPAFLEGINRYKLLVDIGFGGGFPILPLAKKIVTGQFIGLEARAKKVHAVTQIAKELALTNVSLFHQRFERIIFDVPCVITFKAVSQIPKLLPLLKIERDLLICFYKGPNVEIQEDLKQIWKQWRLVEHVKYQISDSEERELIVIKPKNVPRGTSKKDKSVVKLSEIL